ncbi:hypothetical protein GCM10009116_14750 [Brevundimonas basaltis]|uniref:Uncharacterized protein (DUF983 family) n=1 Tax=Brevundimonas basaltis TaxID=472166 RepID=A0A7W8HYE6_9CAUL|nr:hypothetical protein [Brevundimonas basaltis]MBB5291212.1 uncharacterized protein (DUF983 family) [Brevundimonas basaltis]
MSLYRVALGHALLSAVVGILVLSGLLFLAYVPGWLLFAWFGLLLVSIALRCPACGRNVYRRGMWVTPVPVKRCSKCDEDLT